MYIKVKCYHCDKVVLNTVVNTPDLQSEEYTTISHLCLESTIHGTRTTISIDNNAPQKAGDANG